MENIPVFSNRLDESNGIVENVLEMKTTKKAPWHLRFAPKAKGLVSFVQNLLLPLTRKEGVRGGQVFAFFQPAAAAVVGIALLVGSTGDVQAACNPPIFDICFHKSSWSSSGTAELAVEFNGESGKLYEVVWHGQKLMRGVDLKYRITYRNDSVEGLSGVEASYSYKNFWWDPDNVWNNYGFTIYEGHYDYSRYPEPDYITWVRGRCVGSSDFYAYQEAAQVGLNTSVIPFSLSQYYCTIDYESEIPDDWAPGFSGPLHGYTQGVWCYYPWSGWHYSGDAGSPRFHYRENCSVTVSPPTRTSENTVSR